MYSVNFIYNAILIFYIPQYLIVKITLISILLFITVTIQHINESEFIPFMFLNVFYCVFSIVIFWFYDFTIKSLCKSLGDVKENSESQIKNKGLLVASLSHDLKNPLSAILGSLDMLKESLNLTEKDQSNIMTASYSGEIMTYLIGNILDISKIENGKFDIDMIPMDIIEEISKIFKIEGDLCRKKKINLCKKVLSPIPNLVYGDPMRFSQIVINIIGNSLKFTSKGYIGLVLTWTNSVEQAKNKDRYNVLIPPEEYFMNESSKRDLRSVSEYYGLNEDYGDCDMREINEPISGKIGKKNTPIQTRGVK